MSTINRQTAIEALSVAQADLHNAFAVGLIRAQKIISELPSEQSEIIRCKDCRWWDKYGDYDNGYCMAAKHGYFSKRWEITIRRTYEGNFYCADAEEKGNRHE